MQTNFIKPIASPSRLSLVAFAASVALLGAVTGCIHEPHHARVHAAPAPVYVEEADYVYYPSYEVYYSHSRHQYIYRDGRSWVSRPSPPRVSVDVLFASPSVRLDFRDAPSRHHSTVVRQYPRHWTPQGSGPGRGPDRDGRR